MNNTFRRPMFRKGGMADSGGTGITSGLQVPRQGYQGTEDPRDQNVYKYDPRTATPDQMRAEAERLYPEKPRDNKDLFIDFGLDLISRPASGGSIFENIGASGQTAYDRYRATNTKRDERLDDKRSDMFTSLIEGQADILGSETGGKTYRDLEISKQLESIIPKIYEIESRVADGTATDDDIMQLDILKTQKNNYTKSNPVTEGAIKIFVSSPSGQNLFNSLSEKLLDEDQEGKYTGEQDVQLYIDTIAQIKKILGQFSSGGRAEYANGELVQEQITETEAMVPGPMGGQNMNTDNPISYDQLRARLPNEITDDIVELMTNSAEALEDFAMISDQSQVDQFNKKYSVNLVLPAEA